MSVDKMQGTFYPSLNKYFENQTELAHAGCMSRQRLYDCLYGIKTFTRAEKKAIAANIVVRIMDRPSFDYAELEKAVRAWKGNFDTEYRKEKANGY